MFWSISNTHTYLFSHGHSVVGVRVSAVQFGLHSPPHTDGVRVLLLQSLTRPLVPHDALTGAVDCGEVGDWGDEGGGVDNRGRDREKYIHRKRKIGREGWREG